MASNPKGHPPFLSVYINLFYFTSSKSASWMSSLPPC